MAAGPSRNIRFAVGLDVGSTTIKGVVIDTRDGQIVWRDYQRHETRQPEKLLEFLEHMERDVGIAPGNCRVFMTGSGGNSLAGLVGAKFVQEVSAVCQAVERLHPEANSIIELGGQDAKIVIFKDDPNSARKRKIPSMNDKCAGGTGAVIDKIVSKLRIPPNEIGRLGYAGIRLHHVAGKCGVFAETDINGLQKQGIPADQLMASLFDAIVLQNLTVLARGHTLRPHVLLLGGPNTFIPGMREAWQHNIPFMWRERQVELPEDATPEDLIKLPENALYFAAIGAVEFAKSENEEVGLYLGTMYLEHYIHEGRQQEKLKAGCPGLGADGTDLQAFREEFKPSQFVSPPFSTGKKVRALVGLDGGSTSTKAVLMSDCGELLGKAYQLSEGNPIEDSKVLLRSLRNQVKSQGASLEVLGIGTTGYAKDILRDVLHADVAIAETVAHAQSALHYDPDSQVIVDLGGQDIKIMVLRDGRIKDFKLNTQCSAGNGYFLQSTAESFGLSVEEYADMAFSAQIMPVFGYGCAVFLQSDIVNFQRKGWRAEEILAGLAAVLPKNVFLYVANVPSLVNLGTRFILQGGTQNNLAVVKAEVDFIRSNFQSSGRKPEIKVHPHCGEAGAIGAALEAARLWKNGRKSTFIGLDATNNITYRTTRNEDTRCNFCKNTCLRTFIDIRTGLEGQRPSSHVRSKVPLHPGEQRLIVASCEKGTVEDLEAMRLIKAGLDSAKTASPNMVDIASREVWKPCSPKSVTDLPPTLTVTKAARQRLALMQERKNIRVGIPRVLNMYVYAPLFSAYLESLGVPSENLVYSDFTTNEMYRSGSSRGSIDPCFPSKIAIAHIHNLIFTKHARKPLQCIFLPMFDVLCSPLVRTRGCYACPTAAVTPETVEAAYTKEVDVFAQHGIQYLHPMVNLSDRRLFARQMFNAWGPVLGLSEGENERATAAGFEALRLFEASIRKRARESLDALEREGRLGVVMLGRPYHHDPGLNHGIPEELQKLGYPVFSQDTLPLDEDLLDRLFGEEVRAGIISHPLDISDVWKSSSAASSSMKVWAAKFTARHPNLVAVEISSFKCGHDAPIYTVVEQIIEQSHTPFFCFKDLDENKPVASIKIRVETIDYFLKRYREDMIRKRNARERMEARLAAYESKLRSACA